MELKGWYYNMKPWSHRDTVLLAEKEINRSFKNNSFALCISVSVVNQYA